MNQWIKMTDSLPPTGVLVDTKIHNDGECSRNEQSLIFYQNLFWTSPSMDMYVYYKPTHWKRIG